jgi:rhodanese-related sulfurtransferase
VFKTVNVKQASELIRDRQVLVIDVREPHEWAEGHIAGARHVPLGTLRANPKVALPDSPVLFVCAAGVRSEAACRLAVMHGAKTVFNLSGGTRAWTRSGLGLEAEQVLSATG